MIGELMNVSATSLSAQTGQDMRRVFMILSPRSLPYAEKCIHSLFEKSLESLNVSFITDSTEDKQTLINAISQIANPRQHVWQVYDQFEGDERAEVKFNGLEHLKAFRHGHPCWRKVTDPLLFSEDGEEMIILDPDLYFPNYFTFEPTPANTLLLMWQKPNCLYPPESVYAAMQASVPLAHHVDIGVAQLRPPIDLEWFNDLIGKLGGTDMPRVMHIEAIVWSALMMKIGGAHLDSKRWLCWHRSHLKRLMLKLGMSGRQILKMEDLASAKCFHAGGPAKWWIADAYESGMLDFNHRLDQVSEPIPRVELTPQMYRRERLIKDWVAKLGYYTLFKPNEGERSPKPAST